jgi:hypothetical protein
MDRLNPGESLTAGRSLDSADGWHTLTVQADGDLALARAGVVRWSSGTAGNPGAGLTMQADGNLVLYSSTHSALWSSRTWDRPGAWAIMQNDGNFVVYASGGQKALWSTDTWLKIGRVDGFTPSVSGLPFRNDYPAGTKWPIVDLPVVGRLLAADAGNGLCGGFGFAVMDMFLNKPRLEPPRDLPRPDPGSPQFEYLTHRLLNTFGGAVPYGTILKIVDWIETPNHDDFLRHGLSHRTGHDEWPKIKRDIDSNRPSPIVLVAPPQAVIADIAAIKKALSSSHQVVACGYELGPEDVTIQVYDPNNPAEDNATVTLSLAHPERPIVAANMGREVRGFFRSHYKWRNPRPVWG